MQRERSKRGGGRRKSAFAEEEEGYMFVEEGFRIRFGNGEVIDFYADSAADKDNWMSVLSETVGRSVPQSNAPAKAWTELVLKHERYVKARQDAERVLGCSNGGDIFHDNPSLPKKDLAQQSKRGSAFMKPSPAMAPSGQPRSSHKYAKSQSELGSLEARRQKTRSLMF